MDLPIIVEKVIFKNESGFHILACSLNAYSPKYNPELETLLRQNIKFDKYNTFTVTIDMINPPDNMGGLQYICLGNFVENKKYGKQFKADFMYADEISNEDGLRAYLLTLPNIKEIRSRQIIQKFGYQGTLDVLNGDVYQLTQINGITTARIPPIKEAWDKGQGERELCMWLHKHNIEPAIGKKIYAVWGKKSVEVLTKNPYCLTDVKGFGFKRADQMAHKLNPDFDKYLRTNYCLKYIINEQVYKNSNLCVAFLTLKEEAIKLLKECSLQNNSSYVFEDIEYKNLIKKCIKEEKDTYVAIKNKNENNSVFVYLKKIWDIEQFIAKGIFERRKAEDTSAYEDDVFDIEKHLSDDGEIRFDDSQKAAIKSVFYNKISVITGSAGSGKTTICKKVLQIARSKDMTVRLMSPTGKAAQILADKTNYPAKTIHSSLRMTPDDELPKESIGEDMILIDEFSMVGIDTMYAIMYAMNNNLWGHLVFIGDPNQLPSVSPGNFLFDIMSSNCVNVVKLDKIHRQSENSYIPLLANDVALGKVISVPNEAEDICWTNLPSPEKWNTVLCNFINDFISKKNINDLQIISPMYKGDFGVNATNDIIQGLMAEVNGTVSNYLCRKFLKFHVGDRVMQTENDSKNSVFNGDIGVVTEVGKKAMKANSDAKSDYVVVEFYGRDLTYTNEEIDQLKLAWCITVHKFQGSQSANIMCIIASEAQYMMTKELLYTAMTRAAKYLNIYGHSSAFRLAPTKSAIRRRYSNLNNMIFELKTNQKVIEVYQS